MSGTKNRPHKRRNIILLVLLALLCIGGVELLVCRFAAPELFQRLTAPVAGLMQRVSDFGEALHSNLQELLSRPGEDEMVNQLARPPLKRSLRRRRARSRSLSPGTGGSI